MTLTLRPYQREGTDFLLSHRKAALWYDPGLGKSFTASEAFKHHLPAVITCPSYLMWQWKDFLNTQYDGMRVSIIEGSKRDKMLGLGLGQPDVYITTIASLRNYPMPQRAQSFVMDEAHHLKGRDALQSKAAAKYAATRTLVIELTATPVRREIDDYYQQLHILDPVTFSSYHKFVEQHCRVAYFQGYRPIIKGVRDADKLAALLAHYGIATTYSDVGIEVPPLIASVLYPELSPTKLKEYKAIRKNYRDGDHVFSNAFQVVDHLRHLTWCHEKLQAVTQFVQDATTPYIVYCCYVDHATQLAQSLGATLITGNTPQRDRIRMARHSKAVVATMGAIEEGGDLTHLKTQIYAEQYYTDDSQNVGRSVRPTDDLTPVLRYDVLLKGTIDEAIYKCRTRRMFDAESILAVELDSD
jgi:superfamily II DNA or RNA helicase